jgi:hypothetical protein
MGIFKSNEGMRCEPTPDGLGLNCKIFESDGRNKNATGTDITIMARPEDNCEPRFVGTVDIMDKDQKKVAEAAEIVRKNCRRGIS